MGQGLGQVPKTMQITAFRTWIAVTPQKAKRDIFFGQNETSLQVFSGYFSPREDLTILSWSAGFGTPNNSIPCLHSEFKAWVSPNSYFALDLS